MRRLWIAGLAIVLAVGVAGVVAAASDGDTTGYFGWMGQGRHASNQAPREDAPPLFSRGLELTAEQREAIERLREEHWTEMAPLRDQVLGLREEYRQAVQNGDEEQLTAIEGELAAIRKQQTALRNANRDAIRDLLTDEQRAQLEVQCPGGGLGTQSGFGQHGGLGHHGGFGHHGGLGQHGGFGHHGGK